MKYIVNASYNGVSAQAQLITTDPVYAYGRRQLEELIAKKLGLKDARVRFQIVLALSNEGNEPGAYRVVKFVVPAKAIRAANLSAA